MPGKMGFHVDIDNMVGERMRIVQSTPPGSACSMTLGRGFVDMQPGSLAYKGLQLVVGDLTSAHDELLARGVQVSEVQHVDTETGGLGSGSWRGTSTRSSSSAIPTATPGPSRRWPARKGLMMGFKLELVAVPTPTWPRFAQASMRLAFSSIRPRCSAPRGRAVRA